MKEGRKAGRLSGRKERSKEGRKAGKKEERRDSKSEINSGSALLVCYSLLYIEVIQWLWSLYGAIQNGSFYNGM